MIFLAMVLEGLKRAECFVGLLRRLGYRREDGRPSKPEHFDQEFANRQHGTVLNDLLTALQARILTDAEIRRLEQLARLGLLDGLIDEEPSMAEGKDDEGKRRDEEEVRRLTELVKEYKEELAIMEGQMNSLLGELTQDTELVITCPPLSAPLGDEVDGSTAMLRDELFRDNLLLNEQLSQLIADGLTALLRPIDTNSMEDPTCRFRSVRSEELVERPWHPEDHAFYSAKIDRAIEIVGKEFKLELQKPDLLRDELLLAELRTVYQQTAFQKLCRLESERMALHRLLIAICQRHVETWSRVLQDTTPLQLKTLVDAMEEYLHMLQMPVIYRRAPAPSTEIQLTDLSHRHEQLVLELSTIKQLLSRLITDRGEVNLIPAEAAAIESQTRAISVELSTLLQSTLTESKRLELFMRGGI